MSTSKTQIKSNISLALDNNEEAEIDAVVNGIMDILYNPVKVAEYTKKARIKDDIDAVLKEIEISEAEAALDLESLNMGIELDEYNQDLTEQFKSRGLF